jgi:hypothetical protein
VIPVGLTVSEVAVSSMGGSGSANQSVVCLTFPARLGHFSRAAEALNDFNAI